MNVTNDVGIIRAADVLERALQVRPEKSSDQLGWRDVTACTWRTQWLSSYEVSETDELIVALHTGGSRQVRSREPSGWGRVRSMPGHLHVLPAGNRTAFMPQGELEFLSIHVAPTRFERLGENSRPCWKIPFRFAFHDPFLSACVHALDSEMRAPREYGALYVDTLTDALLLHLLRSPTPRSIEQDTRGRLSKKTLALLCERIEASLEEGISLDELAKVAGCSRFRLARSFRESVGLPPHRYLTVRRLERAKHLLCHTKLSIVDIAGAVGFCSQAHFTRQFRLEFGVTPAAFRAKACQ